MNCTSTPPAAPALPLGTRAWSGSLEFTTSASYSCGPYASFNGTSEVEVECKWNRTWTPQLPACQGQTASPFPQCHGVFLHPCSSPAMACPLVGVPPSSSLLVLHQHHLPAGHHSYTQK